jgi:hypothetical protein
MPVRGSAINYPGNPRFRSQCAFKSASSSKGMEGHRRMLANHALFISDDGPMGVCAREEVKDLIQKLFGISKHEFSVSRSSLEPFLAIFHKARDRDMLFAAGRLIDGPVELSFHAWDPDRNGVRDIIPYNVKLSLEGIPHHAWYREVADKVLCDEVVIYHVEEDSLSRIDQRSFDCWALSKDPSRIP